MPDFQSTLVREPPLAKFDSTALGDIPAPARAYLASSIRPGSPLWVATKIQMRGKIRIGRWLPFKATETLNPHVGFVWEARVAGLISGHDRYVSGHGDMLWRLGGVKDLVVADGPDVSRSAAVRAAAEAIWLPTSLHPVNGVSWTQVGEGQIRAAFAVDGHAVSIELQVSPEGKVLSVLTDRWGDPDGSGDWGAHPFGAEFTEWEEHSGLTIPVAGSVGWFYGCDSWSRGEFFRFTITDAQPL